MANRTLKDVKSIHQTNPQYLIERIIRGRIYECRFWKEDCFGINEESLVDRSTDLKFVGGIYGGNIKPTPFLCLILKMLQIQPHMDIIIEFIKQTHFKYSRALSAYYLRLTANSLDVYKYLEPLYNDYRKLRYIDRMGKFSIIHMDEFIDMLLREDRVFDVILPRISARRVHEELGELEPRASLLEEELDVDSEDEATDESGEIEVGIKKEIEKRHGRGQEIGRDKDRYSDREDQSRKRKWNSERDRDRDRSRERERIKDRDRDRGRDRERDRGRDRSRDRHRDKDRDRDRNKYDRYSNHSRREERTSIKRRERSSERHKDNDRDRGRSTGGKTFQDEIDEANALRAKLGLAPLKQ